jgi:hypothetical protein
VIGHRLTGSRSDLAAKCLYWARPDVTVPASVAGPAAGLGSATHAVIESAGESESTELDIDGALSSAAGGLEEAIAIEDAADKWHLSARAREELGELYATWAAWWPEWRGSDVYKHEVPMAWDCAKWSARVLPSRHQRDYSAITATEIPMTIDAVHLSPDGETATVIDWKTGRRQQRRAEEHKQLASAALCVAHAFDVLRVRVVLVRIRPGWIGVDDTWLDEMALDAHALALDAQLRDIPNATPSAGPWCGDEYCPAMSVCEGPRVLARRAPELARSLPVVVETEEQAAAVLACAKPLEAYVAELKRSARAWAERNGRSVRMPDGSVMRLEPETRRSIDLERAEPALRARFGDACDGLIRVKRTVSVGDIEKLVKASAPRGKKEKAAEEAIEALATTGGLKVSVYDQWKAVK